jgi:rhamnulokinase
VLAVNTQACRSEAEPMSWTAMAVDLGATSGRAIVGEVADDRLTLTEVHRFPNQMLEVDGHLRWQVHELLGEIRSGLRRARERGHGLSSIGIDTWGVDYGLLDTQGDLLDLPYAYRDHRTDGVMERVLHIIPRERIYEITGIQFMPINTIYQLVADAAEGRFANARRLLMMPDLIAFLLCGEARSELTIASTSQLLDCRTRAWATELCEPLGIPAGILPPVVGPGTQIGAIGADFGEAKGLKVIAPAGHDTACAVAAVPGEGDDWAYISAGTWCLVGTLTDQPVTTEAARQSDLTNEAAADGGIRLLKNVTGLWLLEECRRIWAGEGPVEDYAALCEMAAREPAGAAPFDPDHPALAAPDNMLEALALACREAGSRLPETRAGIARAIFEAIAAKMGVVLRRLEQVTGREYRRLHMVGGGSRNALLCQLTADACGLPVIAGPAEATAYGNIVMQAVAAKRLDSPQAGRDLVRRSVELRTFEPVGA